jgi:hypothetical protein
MTNTDVNLLAAGLFLQAGWPAVWQGVFLKLQ